MTAFLRWLVRLYPAGFRSQFGADMGEQIERDWSQMRGRGLVRAAVWSVVTAADLAGAALAERWDPAWRPERVTTVRRARMTTWTSGWTSDLRHAARAVVRAPGFAVVTVFTLGLGIGANAGIFSVIETVLLDPLPYGEADRLVHIAASAPGTEYPEEFGVSAEFYVQYAEQSALLEEVAVYSDFTNTVRVGEQVERARVVAGTASLLHTLGAEPVLGRLPVPEDESGVAVISHGMWTTWFGQDPDVIGQSHYMAGDVRTIIGVLGPDFWFPRDDVLLWYPYVVRPEGIVPGRFGAGMIGRMAPGAGVEGVAAELTRLARTLPARFGGNAAYARTIERHRAVVRPLSGELLGAERPLWVLLGAVGIVLLIACANVANLFLVRAERRQRDMAVRKAIGAARAQLIRSQMAEAFVVAAGAAVVAVLLARAAVPLFVAAAPADVPRLDRVGIHWRTIAFTAALALVSALLCGLLPAIRASGAKMTRLREGGRGATRRRHWSRDGLVVAQTALALVLLIGSGLLIRSFEALRSVDPGYETADRFTFQIAPENADLVDGPSFARFHLNFRDRLAAMPGVEAVGIIENVPLNEGTATGRFRSEEMVGAGTDGTLLNFTFADGSYFPTMGVDVQRGRVFEDADHLAMHGSIVISRSAAELLWPGQDPIGRRLEGLETGTLETVIGVVEDVMQENFRQAAQPVVYFPLAGRQPTSWVLSSPAYVVKSRGAEVIGPEIRALVREVAPGAPMYREYTMAGLAADSMVDLSFTMLTLGVVSLLALVLGAVGLYGVLSYVVAERTKEIGVRMALGAEAGKVRRMVVAQGGRVVGIGVAIGILVAFAATRVLGGLLFGVAPLDAATFLAMTATMILVGLLASYVPARRASSVDPILSLRGD
jgi:putative ABC transport system permease protein